MIVGAVAGTMTQEERANVFVEKIKAMLLLVSGPETLDAAFLGAMQLIGLFGMLKHSRDHYKLHEERPQKDGRFRDMLEHALEHMNNYKLKEEHELGDCRFHLVAAAFNLMMEFYFFTKEQKG